MQVNKVISTMDAKSFDTTPCDAVKDPASQTCIVASLTDQSSKVVQSIQTDTKSIGVKELTSTNGNIPDEFVYRGFIFKPYQWYKWTSLSKISVSGRDRFGLSNGLLIHEFLGNEFVVYLDKIAPNEESSLHPLVTKSAQTTPNECFKYRGYFVRGWEWLRWEDKKIIIVPESPKDAGLLVHRYITGPDTWNVYFSSMDKEENVGPQVVKRSPTDVSGASWCELMDEKIESNIYTVNCISCRPPDKKEKACTFYEDVWCRAILRDDNQCWLGRFIIVPKMHMDPLDFWADVNKDRLRDNVMNAYVLCSKAVIKAFGANCVQMAQLGRLTVDHKNEPTTDQRYQHAHIHGIPRYTVIPEFMGKKWPDPQFKNGEFSALNIDPQAGLPKVVPSSDEIAAMVKVIQTSMHSG